MKIFKKIYSFFLRVFTDEAFPARTKGKADKEVGDIYNVKTFDSESEDRKIIVLDPKQE